MKTQIYGISIGTRLCTERTKIELSILTSATRTRSSLPLKTLLKWPSFQSARFFLSLATKTTSPSCTVAPLRLLDVGLARRYAVALKVEKSGAKGCLGGIASAGWLEDHQMQSFSREKLFELCKKKRSCFCSFSNGNVTKRFCFPWGLLARWHFTSFGDCASLKVTFRVDAFYELMLYLLWGEVDVKGKKAELTERWVWSCLFLHTYKPDPIPRRPS